ncbi:MAG TPA: DUF6401 family natural product biosynthesis protein [Micromonosporaceae bacterium]|nr:DUF6401 family natural product biosynthesis protein [Micromonosporaceae bacterium]
MSRQLDASATGSRAIAAHAALASLGSVIGSGLTAARRQPRLLALLDQHAAAVRDSLRGDLAPLSAVALVRYAEGVRDAAREHGWHLPDGPVDWTTTTDWVQTRLLAVYALARGGWPAPD